MAAHALAAQSGIGVARGAHDREAQRLEHGAEHAAVTERERPDGVAVIGVAQGEEGRAPRLAPVGPVLECDLEGLLHRDRPIPSEEEVGIVDRDHCGQRLGQLDDHGVAVAQHGGVGDLGRLLGQGPVERGDVVAEGVDPEGGDRIEVAVARGVDEFPSLGPLDDQRGVLGVRRHLGEAVPDDGGIPLDPAAAGARPGPGPGPGWRSGWGSRGRRREMTRWPVRRGREMLQARGSRSCRARRLGSQAAHAPDSGRGRGRRSIARKWSMDLIGVVDTMFARYDMGGEALDELAQCPGYGTVFTTIRRTVPGFKDLAVQAKKLIEEDGCRIVVALGMPGREQVDKVCAHEASTGIMTAQLMTNTPILEVFVHEDESDDPATLAMVFRNRSRDHARNAYLMLYEPEELTARAGQGVRQGFANAGPLEV